MTIPSCLYPMAHRPGMTQEQATRMQEIKALLEQAKKAREEMLLSSTWEVCFLAGMDIWYMICRYEYVKYCIVFYCIVFYCIVLYSIYIYMQYIYCVCMYIYIYVVITIIYIYIYNNHIFIFRSRSHTFPYLHVFLCISIHPFTFKSTQLFLSDWGRISPVPAAQLSMKSYAPAKPCFVESAKRRLKWRTIHGGNQCILAMWGAIIKGTGECATHDANVH